MQKSSSLTLGAKTYYRPIEAATRLLAAHRRRSDGKLTMTIPTRNGIKGGRVGSEGLGASDLLER